MQDEEQRPLQQLPVRSRAVGPGWHHLLLHLHEEIRARSADYQVDDLKEKIGTLRIRITGMSDLPRHETQALGTTAEERFAATCEFCGAPGRLRNDASADWIKSVSDSCHSLCSQHTIMIAGGAVQNRPPRHGRHQMTLQPRRLP
ncbi:hypothetical protein ABZT45_34150 [Streptomyces sp. NPDC005356]|uniref:hypothetical protein n=1 Tax=Streptomyces sp. NPDC005356 TaxID=3157167 RepID=UPI0033B2C5C8